MNVPKEFDIIGTAQLDNKKSPFGVGYTMKGWDFSANEIVEALRDDRMLNPAYELASNACPWNCFFCFTEDPDNPEESKKRLKGEMSLDDRISLIDQSVDLGAKSINIIGAGEPTIDRYFWQIVEHIASKGITPIVYTEGALKLTDQDFAKRLYDTGATVVLKVNSLADEAYQNETVKGGTERRRPLKLNYFTERNKALEVLMDTGFNDHDPTRLAFDTIICKENYDEIPAMHRFARDNNIFVLFVGYLPSGRSTSLAQNAVSKAEQFAMFDELARIDKVEYGIEHKAIFPYAGGVPCSIRGLGLYVKIRGEVWDCPGEMEPMGNATQEPLTEIWNRAKEIRAGFNGGCPPRDAFWQRYETANGYQDGSFVPIESLKK